MSAFTKGPYKRLGVRIFAPRNRFVATVSGPVETPDKEIYAVVALFQFAPDLYEALENLLDFASEYHSTSISALGRAQEALAKARGEK